ncbi:MULTISPECIES: hypothetical protein [Acetobacter]|uniref:hypothetical protein n=1 Tax=Acetobacter TaxID=434 RepID=UPI0012FE4AE8|nr:MULTISPECIES: hypothetical protein [Acetobacter]
MIRFSLRQRDHAASADDGFDFPSDLPGPSAPSRSRLHDNAQSVNTTRQAHKAHYCP